METFRIFHTDAGEASTYTLEVDFFLIRQESLRADMWRFRGVSLTY